MFTTMAYMRSYQFEDKGTKSIFSLNSKKECFPNMTICLLIKNVFVSHTDTHKKNQSSSTRQNLSKKSRSIFLQKLFMTTY